MAWQETENEVRRIASFLWNREAISETINGVKCDSVIRLSDGRCIIIEITEESDLAKIREDIAKIFSVRNYLISQNIFAECYIIMKDKPTDSMRSTGNGQYVKVISVAEFRKLYFNYPDYKFQRKQRSFGSLINLETGEPEKDCLYIEVKYRNITTGENLTISQITSLLIKGKKIILKGDFGTGKSRCVKQLFSVLADLAEAEYIYPIAINLREHWGAKRGTEIIDRHFFDLGIKANNFKKTYMHENTIYLLDGFDEIGTQSWSPDLKKMQHIRESSVVAIKDLIQTTRGGLLITGREHYFNSDTEMLECLGLDSKNTIILECNNEFTNEELFTYLNDNFCNDMGENLTIPAWLPRRPLVIQVVLKYALEIFTYGEESGDLCDFWYLFLDKLCEREARINALLNPNTIKHILFIVARITRNKANIVGPISNNDLAFAFESVIGTQPTDESSIMLQRLPGLGRISADTTDRQFVDSFILDGLKAEDIINCVNNLDRSVFDDTWRNSLGINGYYILSEYIEKEHNRQNSFMGFAKQAAQRNNPMIALDILSAILLTDNLCLDFGNICIEGGKTALFSCENKKIKNIRMVAVEFGTIDLSNADISENVFISTSDISEIVGLPSNKGLPPQFIDCDIGQFQSVGTVSRIKKAKLSDSQKIFVAIIKKIFFQPGKGRKEEALFRGLGDLNNKRLAEKITNKLLDEGIIHRRKGDEGWVYSPERKNTDRMDKILSKLTQSDDPLWVYVSNL